MRIGIGYDSHRFAEGRRLVLGGVEIEHDARPQRTFRRRRRHPRPDRRPARRRRARRPRKPLPARRRALARRRLDRHAANRPRAAPRAGRQRRPLGDRRAAAARRPPRGDGAQPERRCSARPVSVKATSNEGMGFIGRGEGIACVAVALSTPTSEPRSSRGNRFQAWSSLPRSRSRARSSWARSGRCPTSRSTSGRWSRPGSSARCARTSLPASRARSFAGAPRRPPGSPARRSCGPTTPCSSTTPASSPSPRSIAARTRSRGRCAARGSSPATGSRSWPATTAGSSTRPWRSPSSAPTAST